MLCRCNVDVLEPTVDAQRFLDLTWMDAGDRFGKYIGGNPEGRDSGRTVGYTDSFIEVC